MHSVVVIDGEARIDLEQDGDIDIDLMEDGEGEKVILSETGTYKHDELIHRDWPAQHPISAIDGLSEALSNKPDISDLSIIYCGTSTEVI